MIASVFAAAIGYGLLRMPVQVYDSVDEIIDAQSSPSVRDAFWSALVEDTTHIRALRAAQTKLLFDLADGRYRLAYRGFHAALLLAAFLLFTRALRVRTPAELAAAAFALAVLMGLHTFRGTVQEAFPINHFLEVVVFCLVTLTLAQSRGGVAVDVAAALTLAAAALTLESGLLAWVVAVAAWLAGFRGISVRGLALMTVVLAAYFYLRIGYLSIAPPAPGERSSGFLLAMLEPAELQARFGTQPLVFHAYNVLASVLSVLLSEPQNGVFRGVRAVVDGDVPPRVWLEAGSSAATTALVVWAGVQAARGRAVRDDASRLIVVAAAVLAANAAMAFAYTKDEIVSAAGAFYAMAAYAAVREVLRRAATLRPVAGVVAGLLLFALAGAWVVRSAGVHHVLRTQAFKHRNDWGVLPPLWKARGQWPGDPERRRLVLQLRDEALAWPAPNPRFEPRWAYRWWGE